MVNCPNCDAVIDVEEDELGEGETLICEDCGANLTVTNLDPLEVESMDDEDAEDEEEDFDLDEDDEDDDEEEEEEEEEDEEDWK
jgi:alpha-aminoadipate carrier protein LysW